MRRVELPQNLEGHLFLHSMPGRYEPFEEFLTDIVPEKNAVNRGSGEQQPGADLERPDSPMELANSSRLRGEGSLRGIKSEPGGLDRTFLPWLRFWPPLFVYGRNPYAGDLGASRYAKRRPSLVAFPCAGFFSIILLCLMVMPPVGWRGRRPG